jgi:hypothetical protein
MMECATKMATHYNRAMSKGSKHSIDVCAYCGRDFEVLRSHRYLQPHVCPKCRKLSSTSWESKFQPQVGSSVKDAWTNFFLSIKKKAVEDGKLEDWRKYWVQSNALKKIWMLLQEEATKETSRPVASHETPEYN